MSEKAELVELVAFLRREVKAGRRREGQMGLKLHVARLEVEHLRAALQKARLPFPVPEEQEKA